MSTSIDQFLSMATGPERLQAELIRTAKPLRALSRALHRLEALETTIPQAIFGGELLTLLSEKMARALMATDDGDVVVDMYPVRRLQLPTAHDTDFGSTTPHFKSRRGKRESTGGIDNPGYIFSGRKHEWRTAKQSFSAPTNDAPPIDAPPGDHFWPETNADASLLQDSTLIDAHTVPPHPNRNSPFSESILERKLRAYWNQRELEKDLQRDKKRLVDMHIPTENRSSSEPTAHLKPHLSPDWPEIFGHQAMNKLHRTTIQGQSGSAHLVEQTVNAELPEKVEIKNVFNIDMKTEGDLGKNNTADLADSIANILREQALQHGIDIT